MDLSRWGFKSISQKRCSYILKASCRNKLRQRATVYLFSSDKMHTIRANDASNKEYEALSEYQRPKEERFDFNSLNSYNNIENRLPVSTVSQLSCSSDFLFYFTVIKSFMIRNFSLVLGSCSLFCRWSPNMSSSRRLAFFKPSFFSLPLSLFFSLLEICLIIL